MEMMAFYAGLALVTAVGFLLAALLHGGRE